MSRPALPADVYLDTSIVVATIVHGTDHAVSCAAFCNDLIAAGSRVSFSQVLRLELSQAFLKLATRAGRVLPHVRSEYRLDDWAWDAGVRERWLHSGVAQFDDLIERFQDAFEVPIDLDIWASSLDVMIEHGLQSLDAVHVATARRLGLTHLATADDHFRRVSSEFDVWLIQDATYP